MSLFDFDLDEFLSFKNYDTLSNINFSEDANFSEDLITNNKKPTQESLITYSDEEIIFQKETKQKSTQTSTNNQRAPI